MTDGAEAWTATAPGDGGDCTDSDPVTLLDVTCREGEQRPGRSYAVEEKVAAVRELDALGVPYVQVGFPVAGPETAAVCESLDVDARLTGIARALPGDVEAAAAAGVDVIDLFAPTSERQRTQLLGQTEDELRATVGEAVDAAHETGCEVHVSAMDGFRTDPAALDRLFGAVDAAYYTIADTVGARTPAEVRAFLADVGTEPARLGVHFHDDLGVATANGLAAVAAGVRKVDVSVAGVGERAGNAPLEEFVVGATRSGFGVTADADALVPRCRAVLDALGEVVPPAKAILGERAFAHESGLHTAAMLDDPATFEPFSPAQFGGERRLLFGRQSGRGAARRLLERAGVDPTDERCAALLDRLHGLGEEIGVEAAVVLARDVAGD